MSTSYLRLNKTAGDPAADPRAWLAFALEAAGATRWEIAMPAGSFSLTELWQRLTGDDAAMAIPRADLQRLRAPLAALLGGERAEIAFEFTHADQEGRPVRRRSVIRLVGPDPANGRPRRLRGLNFRLPPPGDAGEAPIAHEDPPPRVLRGPGDPGPAIAHELREPAQAVSRLADLLLARHGEALADDARFLAARLAVAARDLEATLEALAGLARLAKQELLPVRADLAALAREAWSELAPGDAAHASRLVLACAGASPVRADLALLRALLRNLLGNAFKFTHANPDSPVTLAWVEGPPPHFVVRDRGAGFDGAAARDLFEPFGRQHRGAHGEGLGIGLAIARCVVERHGGRIWAESRPGEGAAFHFTLPAA